MLDEFIGDLDAETRWAMAWYRDHGWEPWAYDDAEKGFKTQNTSLEALERAGVATSRSGKVWLQPRAEYPADWGPATDRRVTVWEVAQHLTQRLATAGEQGAGALLSQTRKWADEATNLARWLTLAAVEKGRSADALDYDALVTSWPELERIASRPDAQQGTLLP